MTEELRPEPKILKGPYDTNIQINGQAAQDYFVLYCLKEKKQGTFLEIGSNHPININNTYVLEKNFGWTGFLIEYEEAFLPLYKEHRPRSYPIIADATTLNFRDLCVEQEFPKDIDYLQIDLDVSNRSTLTVLENINTQMMDDYRFAVITFEHDIYNGDYFNTRQRSREIFESRGYTRVFSDVNNKSDGVDYPFEDWYVHPELVDMERIRKVQTEESLDYRVILRRLFINRH